MGSCWIVQIAAGCGFSGDGSRMIGKKGDEDER